MDRDKELDKHLEAGGMVLVQGDAILVAQEDLKGLSPEEYYRKGMAEYSVAVTYERAHRPKVS